MLKNILFVLLFTSLLQAEVLISPQEAIKNSIEGITKIEKKSIILTASKSAYVEKSSKLKLKSKIFRTYKAFKKSHIQAYAILVPRKVRSKNGVALYIFSPSKKLLSVEVIAFNEPHEYIPRNNWLKQFKGKNNPDELRVGKAISAITGATLSAKSVTDGARIATAIMDIIVK